MLDIIKIFKIIYFSVLEDAEKYIKNLLKEDNIMSSKDLEKLQNIFYKVFGNKLQELKSEIYDAGIDSCEIDVDLLVDNLIELCQIDLKNE